MAQQTALVGLGIRDGANHGAADCSRAWQVTLDVRARKVVVDEAGVETEVPMNDWIEIGVFGESESYVQQHIVRSGKQTITVTVAQMPDRAGIDPRHLLSELGEIDANIKTVKIGN